MRCATQSSVKLFSGLYQVKVRQDVITSHYKIVQPEGEEILIVRVIQKVIFQKKMFDLEP